VCSRQTPHVDKRRTGHTKSTAYLYLRWGKLMSGGGTDCHGLSILRPEPKSKVRKYLVSPVKASG
jgi:hypothetical protein